MIALTPKLLKIDQIPTSDGGTFGLEATPRIELGMEVLQTSALPLGYVAALRCGFYRRR